MQQCMGGGNRQNYLLFLRGVLFEQRGYFRRATGVTFFLEGCFSSRGGTSDMQRDLFLSGGTFDVQQG